MGVSCLNIDHCISTICVGNEQQVPLDELTALVCLFLRKENGMTVITIGKYVWLIGLQFIKYIQES